MTRRRTNLLVLGFACLWFGMLVPVHQRGQIRLPGPSVAEGAATRAATHCKRTDANAPCRQSRPAPDEQPAKPGDCAVCHFIAGLDAPPLVTLGVAPLGLLGALPPEASPAAPLRHAALPYHGLDPPLA